MAGIPSIAASSSNEMQSPVFPLPVIPTHIACVHRSLASYINRSSVICACRQVVMTAEVKRSKFLEHVRRRCGHGWMSSRASKSKQVSSRSERNKLKNDTLCSTRLMGGRGPPMTAL